MITWSASDTASNSNAMSSPLSDPCPHSQGLQGCAEHGRRCQHCEAVCSKGEGCRGLLCEPRGKNPTPGPFRVEGQALGGSRFGKEYRLDRRSPARNYCSTSQVSETAARLRRAKTRPADQSAWIPRVDPGGRRDRSTPSRSVGAVPDSQGEPIPVILPCPWDFHPSCPVHGTFTGTFTPPARRTGPHRDLL